MENWRFKAKSITKHNPNIDERVDDWTSYSDIGKSFNNVQLTYLRYELVEEKIINSCFAFFKILKLNTFQIIDLHKTSKSKDFEKTEDDKILFSYYKDLSTNVEIELIHLKYFVQIGLREYASFAIKIDEKTNSFIHFGYDYHIYFVSDTDLTLLDEDISELGLFIA